MLDKKINIFHIYFTIGDFSFYYKNIIDERNY